jgi:hypothetical protein
VRADDTVAANGGAIEHGQRWRPANSPRKLSFRTPTFSVG